MLHAKIPDGFFDFGATGLDGDACELMLNKLDDDECARFLGNAIVGLEYSETTAAHEIRTCQTVEKLIDHVVKHPVTSYKMKCHYKAMIVLHDVSDALKEVIIASTETDKTLKAQYEVQLNNYDMAVTPFLYQLALYSHAENTPSLYGVTVDEMRQELMTTEQRSRGFSMPEAIDFCDRAVKLVAEQSADFSKCRLWNASSVKEKISLMMNYYNEIEKTKSFAGMQSQIHEKSDGTQYACSISKYKNQFGLMPTHYHAKGAVLNRINGRYEKNLHTLMSMTNNKPQKIALAAGTIQHCYNISKNVYTLSKPYISLNDIAHEPGEDDAHDLHLKFAQQQKDIFAKGQSDIVENSNLVALYSEAMEDLAKRGICWLPEKDKTLADSRKITKIGLGYRGYKPVKEYLKSFSWD